MDVVPHARLITAPSDRTANWSKASTALRIAHLGARLFHKGWRVYEELAGKFAIDHRYLFFQLGTNAGPHLPDCIRNIPVGVTGQERLAMVEAVAEARPAKRRRQLVALFRDVFFLNIRGTRWRRLRCHSLENRKHMARRTNQRARPGMCGFE